MPEEKAQGGIGETADVGPRKGAPAGKQPRREDVRPAERTAFDRPDAGTSCRSPARVHGVSHSGFSHSPHRDTETRRRRPGRGMICHAAVWWGESGPTLQASGGGRSQRRIRRPGGRAASLGGRIASPTETTCERRPANKPASTRAARRAGRGRTGRTLPSSLAGRRACAGRRQSHSAHRVLVLAQHGSRRGIDADHGLRRGPY